MATESQRSLHHWGLRRGPQQIYSYSTSVFFFPQWFREGLAALLPNMFGLTSRPAGTQTTGSPMKEAEELGILDI